MSKTEKRVPKLRFTGFIEDWEQRKLGDLMTITSVKRIHQSDWTHSGVRFLRARDIVSAAKNEEPTDYLYISEEKYNEYSLISGKVTIGDLLVTGVGSIGVPLLITNDDPVYFKDGNVIWFKNGNVIDGKFFYYSFVHHKIQKFIKDVAGIGTVGTYTIDSGKKTLISLPIKKEQTKIGAFFKQLDDTIALHQRKLELLKQLKETYLKALFPQNDENIPALRFAGFSDSWEQRKLGDLGSFKNGMNFDKSALGHGHPFVNLQNIFGKTIVDDMNLGLAVSSEKQRNEYNLLQGDILFIRSSVKLEGVGEAALVPKKFENTTFSGFLIRFRPHIFIDDEFKRVIFTTKNARNQIMALATSSANTNINQNSLEKIVIELPELSEQSKIGNLFKHIDNAINLHQSKLEKILKYKHVLLGKMFL